MRAGEVEKPFGPSEKFFRAFGRICRIAYFCIRTKDKMLMNGLYEQVSALLLYIGIDKADVGWSARLALIGLAVLVSYASITLFRHVIMPAVRKVTSHTKATWDDYLFNESLMKSFCRMLPPVILYVLLPFALEGMNGLLALLQKACLIYIVVSALRLVKSFLDSVYEISSSHEAFRDRPLKGIYQMVNLVAISIGVIFIISILIGQNAGSILAGLGASAAVLMLIFKDSILGLVAGVQLSVNDMLRPGDWITMSKYGADGYVLEVSLTTVKVQNFDKTITTIPPYALVSDSFQNWRGMRESGGRRIKRAVLVDLNTVRFCTPDEKKRFLLKGWLTEEEAERNEAPVNLKVFRNYLLQYLKQHPQVNQDMMIMIRQMQPTAEGLPLEIYCFSKVAEWVMYESIQGGIMDHVFAVLPQFGLRMFQRPAGTDLSALVG